MYHCEWSTQLASCMSLVHGTSLLSTPGRFEHLLFINQRSKNNDKEHCFLKNFGFTRQTFEQCWQRLGSGQDNGEYECSQVLGRKP